jgi:hypothetical protein
MSSNGIVGQLRHLKAFQLPVAAMQRNQFSRLIHRSIFSESSRQLRKILAV